MKRKKYVKNLEGFIDFIKRVKTEDKKVDRSWMTEFEEIEKKYGVNGDKKKY